jgi:hypothetical protein
MKSDVVHGVVFEQEKELQKMMRSYIRLQSEAASLIIRVPYHPSSMRR